MIQHVEISKKIEWSEFPWGSLLIFANIKRFMNKDNRTSYPSCEKIAELCECSRRKVLDSIKCFEKLGLIKVTRKGHSVNFYYFEPEADSFEMYTPTFLDLKTISASAKEFYIRVQPFLYNKETGIGNIALSYTELAKKTNLSIPTVRKYIKELVNKEMVTIDKSKNVDLQTNSNIIPMNFSLKKFGLFELWARGVNDALEKNAEELKKANDRIAILEKKVDELTKNIKPIEFNF